MQQTWGGVRLISTLSIASTMTAITRPSQRYEGERMNETPDLRWFDPSPKCPCGKPSVGILRGVRNESYGFYCLKCANRRLAASEKVRRALADDTKGEI